MSVYLLLYLSQVPYTHRTIHQSPALVLLMVQIRLEVSHPLAHRLSPTLADLHILFLHLLYWLLEEGMRLRVVVVKVSRSKLCHFPSFIGLSKGIPM